MFPVLQAQSGVEDDSFYQPKNLQRISASMTFYVPNLDWPIH